MSKYDKIIEYVFLKNYNQGSKKVAFDREELADACVALNMRRIKNLGDIPYNRLIDLFTGLTTIHDSLEPILEQPKFTSVE